MGKRLAESEWIILQALWEKPPQTLKQIVSCIQKEQPDVTWDYKTYHTYLRNMCKKKFLKAEERNLKDKLYSALVSREDAIAWESENLLLRKSYYGSIGRLVMFMAESGRLTEQDKKELMELAAKLESDPAEK